MRAMRLAGVWGALWVAVAGHFAQAQVSPELRLLGQIKQKMAQNLSRIPNYTCIETMERSHRASRNEKFKVADTVRLEVALVNGKELFSWPGAGRFEEKPLSDLVPGGMTSTGDFALHARTVFLTRSPSFQYVGEETLGERRAVRFDYRVPLLLSGYRMHIGEKQAAVGYRGSFWADRETLELLRLQVHVDEVPPDLGITHAITEIDYGKVRVGFSDFLLPQSVEFVMGHGSGRESRNRTEFTACRQYVGQVVLSFDEAPPSAPPRKQQVPVEVEVPAGLSLNVRLKTGIDSQKSVVGDPIMAVVEWPVKREGKVIVPKGAVLSGRIRVLEKRTLQSDYYLVGLEFDSLQFENKRARLSARLESIGPLPGLPRRRGPYLTERALPGVSTFLISGSKVQLPAGLGMTWKTAAKERE